MEILKWRLENTLVRAIYIACSSRLRWAAPPYLIDACNMLSLYSKGIESCEL